MRSIPRVLLLAALVLVSASSLYAANCLQQVGEPYEKGDQVCIQVKNNCNEIVSFKWSVGTYDFGIHGEPNVGNDSGTKAVAPNATIEVCSDKPDDAGSYCFRFQISNYDQTNPYDRFHDWLNNIEVAMAGGFGFGDFEVGGSGLLAEDVVLAVEAPAGWSMNLSTTFVSADSFPASVQYQIVGPEGEDAVLKVVGIGTETGEIVGDATFTVVATANEPPTTEEPPADGDDGDTTDDNGNPDAEPVPAPTPALSFGQAEHGGVVDTTLLFAWDEKGVFDPTPEAFFEVYGAGSWEPIDTDGNSPAGADFGIATAVWDTTDLPPGDYRVRVTMTGDDGQVGITEEVVTVLKRPEPIPVASSSRRSTFDFDASGSFDLDGAIVDWRWRLGDGTVASGPRVTHTYPDGGSYPVDLTVTDDTGLETTAYCLADADSGDFVCEARSCGCESMDIRGAGTDAGIEFPDYVGGGTANGPQVPGPGSDDFNYRFEVLAELKPGSDPSKCEYQQWVKRTATIDGTDHHKEHDGESYPLDGDAYGEDGPEDAFSEADGASDPPTIRWIDAPGYFREPVGSDATYTAEFFAMVTGPLGTCKCSWKIDMAIAADGTVVRPPTLTDKKCS